MALNCQKHPSKYLLRMRKMQEIEPSELIFMTDGSFRGCKCIKSEVVFSLYTYIYIYINIRFLFIIHLFIIQIKSNQIKSLLLSHHHSTSALVSEILMSVLQTVQKTTIYIWTVHIYRLYRRQCAKYTYIYTYIYYKDILNFQTHYTPYGHTTLCTLSIHYVVYT